MTAKRRQAMQSVNHSYYLRKMGIQQWLLRDQPDQSLPAPVFEPCYFYSLGSRQLPIGVLVAEQRLASKDEAALVEAIVKATQQRFTGGLCEESYSLPTSVKVVVVLGNISTESGAYRTLVTHAPADMINNKALKSEAWQVLKEAMKLMAET